MKMRYHQASEERTGNVCRIQRVQIHARSRARYSTRRDAAPRSRISETRKAQPKPARSKTEAETRLGPLRSGLEDFRRFSLLPGQFLVCETLPDNLIERALETCIVADHLAIFVFPVQGGLIN